MPTLTRTVIAEEQLATCYEEALPLLRMHWQEIATHHDIPLSINLPFYETAEREGKLCIITARAPDLGHRIVGYSVFFLSAHPHYSTSLQAVQDIFYVDPSARGAMIGLKLITMSEAILGAKGVQVVYHHVKIHHPMLGRLLDRKGYTTVETILGKRLDGVT